MNLLAIFMCSWGKCSGPLPVFNWIVCCFGVELYEFFLYFGYQPLTGGLFANIFSCSVACLFVLLLVSFPEQKLFSLMQSRLFTFAFTSLAFGVRFRKASLNQRSISLVPVFSSVCFSVANLIFKCLIHLSQFSCMVSNSLVSFLCMRLASFPNTIY